MLIFALLALTLPQAAMTLIGGAIVDRFHARTVLLWSDSMRIGTAGLLALLTMNNTTHIVFLCSILACHGLGWSQSG